jgi:PIN domain nuclease of toxin-antitoxin system
VRRVLCDTNAAIWWFAGLPRLNDRAETAIKDADTVFLSLASVWEISIKIGKFGRGRSPAMDRLMDALKAGEFAGGFELLAPSVEDYIDAGLLPRHHGDPFDRLLIAQAQNGGMPIVSSDRAFDAYGVERIW